VKGNIQASVPCGQGLILIVARKQKEMYIRTITLLGEAAERALRFYPRLKRRKRHDYVKRTTLGKLGRIP